MRKTGDLEKNVKDKFPEQLESWKEVKRSSNPFDMRTFYLSNLTQQYLTGAK